MILALRLDSTLRLRLALILRRNRGNSLQRLRLCFCLRFDLSGLLGRWDSRGVIARPRALGARREPWLGSLLSFDRVYPATFVVYAPALSQLERV